MDAEEPADHDDAPLAELAYQLAVRGLGQQEAGLAELRARTGTLLTAASLLVTFLGALAIDREGLGVFAVPALVAYALAGALSVWILVPKPNLILRVSGPELYPNSDAPDRSQAIATAAPSAGTARSRHSGDARGTAAGRHEVEPPARRARVQA
jgi:hypothetical protein